MPEIVFDASEIPPDLLEFFEPVGAENCRDVLNIATEPYPGSHFATFPRALVEPPIKAGTSEKGCCWGCGAPWVRVVERQSFDPKDYEGKHLSADPQSNGRRMLANVRARRESGNAHDNPFPSPRTVGWKPSCDCGFAPETTVPCTVLDPFAGSGTTGEVALSLGRQAVLIELNPKYCDLIRKRLKRVQFPLNLAV